jgi:acetyl esterase/lipase
MGGSPVNDSYLGKDIAIPKHPFPRGKLPTVVFVHGGSWQRGDKSGLFNEKIADAFAEDGFVGISVNYRLSPEVTVHDERSFKTENVNFFFFFFRFNIPNKLKI